jgi:hypothetical protein
MRKYISVGRVSESLMLLRTIDELNCSSYNDMTQLKVIYGINKDMALEFAIEFGWVFLRGDDLTITTVGKDILQLFYLNTINEELWRTILRQYIIEMSPAWASLIPRGRKEAFIFMSTEERRCFVESGLMNSTSSVVVDWWDNLSESLRKDATSRHLGIGREGERLTLKYETLRTEHDPYWQSVESNLSGFDILSISSRENPELQILIEVKSSNQDVEHAEFVVSRNEWEVATCKNNINRYFFYIWLLGKENALAILKPTDIVDHIPINSGLGSWLDVKIPYSLFINKFKAQNLALSISDYK